MNDAQQAGRSDTARAVVRVGWAAKGVVYLTLAYIVLQMAFGSASEQASTTGAMQLIAGSTAGAVALVVLGIGLLAFAAGRVLEVTALAGPSIGASDRIKAGGLAVVYTGLAISAFRIVGAGSGSSGGKEQQGSAALLGLPGGRWIVGAIGLAVIAVGAWEIRNGLQRNFLPTLRTGEMSEGMRAATTGIGTAAYVTWGAILGLLGVFFLQSAVTYDPSKAKGMDQALREISDSSWGQVLLAAVAVGLLAYGLFGFLQARYRRIGASASGNA